MQTTTILSSAPTPRRIPLQQPILPWVVVLDAGTDDEFEAEECATYQEALGLKRLYGGNTDVMRRRADGSLSTEY